MKVMGACMQHGDAIAAAVTTSCVTTASGDAVLSQEWDYHWCGAPSTYPMNRVWDPENTTLSCPACVTSTGLPGTMQSKCAVTATTCGFLYCIAN